MEKIMIRGALLVDGSGGPSFQADVAVKDGVIQQVGNDIADEGSTVINGAGLVLAPGFIDIHSHTDATIFANPLAESKVFQGVTTEVIGNCGIGCFPIIAESKEEIKEYLKMHGFSFPAQGLNWCDLTSYAAVLEQAGMGVNLAPLVSHGTLRLAVMGSEDRQPTAAELTKMKGLLALCLAQGAWGLSVGLIYPPGSYADTAELLELAEVVAQHKGIFCSHIRGESASFLQAIEEMITIAQQSKVRVEISHLKALGQPYWGQGKIAMDRLLAVSRAGIAIGADQYPYEASSTALSVLVPEWAHSGGVKVMLERLADPLLQEKLEAEINQLITRRGGAEKVMIASVCSAKNQFLVGKRLAEIAQIQQLSPEKSVIRLLLEEAANVNGIYFSISKEDLSYILTQSEVAVGSDGRGMAQENNKDEATHPRSYGTFPRILGTFVREEKVLSLETAVYKMTGLPASRLGFTDRGLIRPGMQADLVLFDPERIIDRSSFGNPHQYAEGIHSVMIGGQLVIEAGSLTGRRPGKVLRKK